MSNSADQLIYQSSVLLDETGDVEAAMTALRDAIAVSKVAQQAWVRFLESPRDSAAARSVGSMTPSQGRLELVTVAGWKVEGSGAFQRPGTCNLPTCNDTPATTIGPEPLLGAALHGFCIDVEP